MPYNFQLLLEEIARHKKEKRQKGKTRNPIERTMPATSRFLWSSGEWLSGKTPQARVRSNLSAILAAERDDLTSRRIIEKIIAGFAVGYF